MEQITSQYPRIMEIAKGRPWAILPTAIAPIEEILNLRAQGLRFDDKEIEARLPAKSTNDSYEISGAIAVLSLSGVMAPKMDLLTAASGGTSTYAFGELFNDAVNNDSIKAIVIDIDSPGGSVFGLPELSDKIYNARGNKPIIAVVNSTMASAAYFVGSAADEIAITPSGEVGSIGTLAIHLDTSKADEKEGLTYTIIRAGKYKAEMNSLEPLTDEAKGYEQKIVDQFYGQFISHVARNRGISIEQVENNYGQGRTFLAADAVNAGIVDRIGTRDDVIQEMVQDIERKGRAAIRKHSIDAKLKLTQIR